jgi:hypothetical protein
VKEEQDDLTLVYMFGYKNGRDSMKEEIERLRAALLESNSLLAAMTLETRPLDEICEQIMQKRRTGV